MRRAKMDDVNMHDIVTNPEPDGMVGWYMLDEDTKQLVRSACRISYQRAIGCPPIIIAQEKRLLKERCENVVNKDDVPVAESSDLQDPYAG